MLCPGCGLELEGIGTFCWTCKEYVDVLETQKVGGAAATAPTPTPGDPNVLEANVREGIVSFFRMMGWMVLDLEQGPRLARCPGCDKPLPGGGNTRVTAGLSDLILIPPAGGAIVFAEVKRALTGKKGGDAKRMQRPEQIQFEIDVKAMGQEYVLWRSAEEAATWFNGRR